MSKGKWPRPSLEVRLWSKIDKKGPDDCWNWIGSPKEGYGHIKAFGRKTSYLTHRIAFILAFGEIPSGIYVCHKCDNKRCCNPNHMFLGTPKDNTQDMLNKGRGAGQLGTRFQPNVSGQNNGRAKLNQADVIFIKQVGPFVLKSDLVKLLKVSRSTILRILKGSSWAN